MSDSKCMDLLPRRVAGGGIRPCQVGSDAEGAPDEVVQIVDEARVLQQSALRPPGGAAGENDVSQAVGVAAPFCRSLLGVDSNLVPVGVHIHPLGIGGQRDLGFDPRQTQQHRDLRQAQGSELGVLTM